MVKIPATDDTIAAVATPPGRGGMAIVRVSGPQAARVLKKVFSPPRRMVSHRLYYGKFIHPSTGRPIDTGLAVIMRAPHSYTGEDVVELHSHGGYMVPKRVLEACIKAGARLAEPGEFTLRAFLNGRLDLAQAEAVADIVDAHSETSLEVARRQLEGDLSARIMEYRNTVIDMAAEVEARIDFPEEEIDPADERRLIERAQALEGELRALAETFSRGRVLKEGIDAVIIGKPNVGKSSLLNRMLMKRRAIVSPSPGTTRDFIEDVIVVDGVLVRLTDTAGLRAASDEVEVEGVDMARRKADEAAVVVVVIDASSKLDDDDRRALEASAARTRVVVLNKTDLPAATDLGEVRHLAGGDPIVSTSAKTGRGIAALKRAIVEAARAGASGGGEFDVIVTEQRHKDALMEAAAALERFADAMRRSLSPEFPAFELHTALDRLGEITGEVTTEEVLGRIFSKFCIGK